MTIRLFRSEDAAAVVQLAAVCARTESDFVLNPMWEDEQEFRAEFERHGIAPEEHLLVAEGLGGEVLGLSGVLRRPGVAAGGLLCPVVARAERGRGIGGELLRATLELSAGKLGLHLAAAGIGTRNRAGYSLLTALGFRPVRQHFLLRCDTRPDGPAPPEGASLEAATEADLEAIHGLYEASGFEPRGADAIRGAFLDGRHAFAVAHFEGRTAGFVELDVYWPRRSWVAFVGVSPGLRGRGLGAALVAWALARRFEAGARSALVILSPANRTALHAYQNVGFRLHRVLDVLELAL
jgi:ribosomal protein S18 acetylase RimI-like enzyme